MPELGDRSVFFEADASNATGTNPGWPEGMAPSRVNDAARALQGALTRDWDYSRFTITSSGSANAYVLTYGTAPAAYSTGMRFSFTTNFGVTGSATVNVNSLGNKTIQKDVGGTLTNLSSGDMASGQYVTLDYNGTVFVWTNWQGPAAAAFSGGTATTPLIMSGKDFREAKGAAVASAGTTDIWTPADGDTVHVTGTTTITSLGTAPQAGAIRKVIFDGALTLTNNATSLILPNAGSNITTAAGDSMEVFADTTANMKVLRYTRINGTALVAAAVGETVITKTADDTRVSTTTLASDTHLTFSMLANTNYRIKGRLALNNSTVSAGFKIGTTGPASPTSVLMFAQGITPNGAPTNDTIRIMGDWLASSGSISFPASGTGNTGNFTIDFEIIWKNGANAGTFAIQTAQQTASGTTTIKTNSEMSYLTF